MHMFQSNIFGTAWMVYFMLIIMDVSKSPWPETNWPWMLSMSNRHWQQWMMYIVLFIWSGFEFLWNAVYICYVYFGKNKVCIKSSCKFSISCQKKRRHYIYFLLYVHSPQVICFNFSMSNFWIKRFFERHVMYVGTLVQSTVCTCCKNTHQVELDESFPKEFNIPIHFIPGFNSEKQVKSRNCGESNWFSFANKTKCRLAPDDHQVGTMRRVKRLMMTVLLLMADLDWCTCHLW